MTEYANVPVPDDVNDMTDLQGFLALLVCL